MGFDLGNVVNVESSAEENVRKNEFIKGKQDFFIQKILDKNFSSNRYEFLATPANGSSFSIPTDNGVYSLKNVVVSGESELFFEANFKEGDKVVCYGSWTRELGEIKFNAFNIYEEIPREVGALRRFLSGKRLPRIGEVTANLIIDRWGIKTFDILDFETEKLEEIKGITKEHIPTIKEKWLEIRKVYEVISVLSEFGVSEGVAKKAYHYYKEKSEYKNKKFDVIEEIRNSPYDLIDVQGIGFKRADHIGLSLGHSENSKKRVLACLKYCLNELIIETGNTAIPASEWILRVSSELGFTTERAQKCCQWYINENKAIFKKITTFDGLGNKREVDSVIAKEMLELEHQIAKDLKRIIDNAPKLSPLVMEEIKERLEQPDIIADDTQKEAIFSVLTNGISVLTGGPGTGKTTTCKNIVHIFSSILRKSIFLAAPTGKAAQRMGEQIGQGIESKTIHRLLEAKNFFFSYNRDNKLGVGVYIIDESSMLDINITAALLEAIPDGSIIIFVGDADQLPSVGAGDVLRDIIKSNHFNVATLKKPHRYSNGADIGINAAEINAGKMPDTHSGSLEKNSSFIFIEKYSDSDILEEIQRVCKLLNEEKGVSFNDIQILSPQKNRLVGVESLNMTLRPMFNPKFAEVANKNPVPKVYTGDRIMQLKNNKEIDLYNGDVGYVKDFNMEDNTFIFNEVISNRNVKMDKFNLKHIDIAYAITVHKSQGSESPYIIIPLSLAHSRTLNRNNLYTGITRAKKMVILIGSKKALRDSIARVKQRLRITTLMEQLDVVFNK